MKHSRKGVAFLGLAGVVAVQAAQFDVSVPVDLARAFAGGGALYRGLPPDFPSFTLPDGLSVTASHDRENIQSVHMRSIPEGGEGQRAMVEALVAEGWMELPEARGATRETGFIIPDTGTPRPANLCHDDLGRIEVRGVTGEENRVFLRRFTYAPAARRPSCEEQRRSLLEQRPPGVPPVNPIMRFIPALAAPGSSLPFVRSVTGFFGGSGARLETEDTVAAADLSPGELLDHYAEQMREQDWEADAQWAGEFTAGGNWTRTVESGERLMTTLRITRVNWDAVIGIRGTTGEEEGEILTLKLIMNTLE